MIVLAFIALFRGRRLGPHLNRPTRRFLPMRWAEGPWLRRSMYQRIGDPRQCDQRRRTVCGFGTDSAGCWKFPPSRTRNTPPSSGLRTPGMYAGRVAKRRVSAPREEASALPENGQDPQ